MTDREHNRHDGHDDHAEHAESTEWIRTAYHSTPEPSAKHIERVIASVHHSMALDEMHRPKVANRAHRHFAWRTVATACAAIIAIAVIATSLATTKRGSGASAATSPHAPNTASTRFDTTSVPTHNTSVEAAASNAQRLASTPNAVAAPRSSAGLSPAASSTASSSTASSSTTSSSLAPPSAASLPASSPAPATSSTPLLSSVPAPASVTSPAPSTPSIVEGLDPETASLVAHIIDSARTRNLPIPPLAARVREGVRRGVPGPRIVVVARNYATALSDSRTALGASTTPLELQSGAEALLAGAPITVLRTLRAARPHGSVAEPLIALADLAAHGVAPAQAGAAMAALAKDPSDAPIRTLRAGVISDIVKGVAPDAALSGRVRQTTGTPASTPRAPSPFDGHSDSTPKRTTTP